MSPEKIRILQQKLKEFLAKTPEELRAIDENPKYDGLFDIIEEMSGAVESSHGYRTFLQVSSAMSFLIQRNSDLPYRLKSSFENEPCGKVEKCDVNSLPSNGDYEYSWAA